MMAPLDLLTASGASIQTYINDENGILGDTLGQTISLKISAGSIAIADYNSDGYDDFIVTGLIDTDSNDSGDTPITNLYQNNTNSIFNLDTSLQGVWSKSIDLGDYDNDGDLDLINSGITADGTTFPIPIDLTDLTRDTNNYYLSTKSFWNFFS